MNRRGEGEPEQANLSGTQANLNGRANPEEAGVPDGAGVPEWENGTKAQRAGGEEGSAQ